MEESLTEPWINSLIKPGTTGIIKPIPVTSINKVINIKQYITDYDYENNLQKLIVENEKIPTIYIKIY